MADTQSVAQAQDQLASANEAATAANNDLAYRKKLADQLDQTVSLARQATLGKTTDSAEYQYYQGVLAQQQDAQDALAAAQQKVTAANNNVATAAQNLTTAQQTAASASQKTAGDAATTNTDPPTQNTGTDSGDHADPVTNEEDSNQEDTEQPDAVVLGGPAYSGASGGRGSYTGYNAADEAASRIVTQVGTPSYTDKDLYSNVSENILDSYASYTYGLTLHVLTREDYNSMTEDPVNFKPTKTLISTANRYSETFVDAAGNFVSGRDPEFNLDFYFDSFKMTTLVGLNSNNRGTNAIDFKFTIVEPYGLTLIDRIMRVNNEGLNGKNYLDMPYLLELNFFGIDDSGNIGKIDAHTKWFPIKLTGMKIKASVKGSEYEIDAIPFNHSAMLESIQAIKTRFEVTAKTVIDYFSSSGETEATAAVKAVIDEDTQRKAKIKAAEADTQARQEAENKKVADQNKQQEEQPFDPEGTGSQNYGEQATRKPKKVEPTDPGVPNTPVVLNTKSFTAAYNAWNKYEYRNGNVKFADTIDFVFLDDTLANSPIVEPKKNPARKVGETDAKTNAQSTSDNKDATPAATADFQATVRSLEAGTAVNDVINMVLTNSKFLSDQTTDPATQRKNAADQYKVDDKTAANIVNVASAKNLPVKMWKIVPRITLGDFDAVRNQWGKNITFYIQTYLAFQTKDDRLPQSLPPPPVKRYDYTYTGHNKSIIDFDINFNCLYYTAYSADRGNGAAAAGAAQTSDENKNSDKIDNQQSKTIDQYRINPNSGQQQTSAGGATQRSDVQNASSAAQESMYTSAGGDMLQCKLHILGDPEFIKQDDLFINPIQAGTGKYAGSTGSLNMDSGEIYCWINFRSPSDFNADTGLYDLDSKNKYTVSEFSGYYRIISVESEFRSGKFTQNLELIRQPKQPLINQRPVQDLPKGLNPRNNAAPTPSDNPAVSGGDLEKDVEPEVGTNLFKNAKSEPELPPEAKLPNSQLVPSDENPFADSEDEDLSTIAEAPEEPETVDEATSADGNTVPIQNAPTLAQTQQNVLAAITG